MVHNQFLLLQVTSQHQSKGPTTSSLLWLDFKHTIRVFTLWRTARSSCITWNTREPITLSISPIPLSWSCSQETLWVWSSHEAIPHLTMETTTAPSAAPSSSLCEGLLFEKMLILPSSLSTLKCSFYCKWIYGLSKPLDINKLNIYWCCLQCLYADQTAFHILRTNIWINLLCKTLANYYIYYTLAMENGSNGVLHYNTNRNDGNATNSGNAGKTGISPWLAVKDVPKGMTAAVKERQTEITFGEESLNGETPYAIPIHT